MMARDTQVVTHAHFLWFANHFDIVKWSHGGNRAQARCPAHDDQDPSLDIDFKDGQILLTCRSRRCDYAAILHAVGLELSDFWPKDDRRPPLHQNGAGWGPPTGSWTYPTRDGSTFGQVLRFDPPLMRKQFIPHHWNGSAMVKGKGIAPWPLYRADEIASAQQASMVFFPAGEKCVDRIVAEGLQATTHQGGEQAWEDRYAEDLAGLDVVICEDNDDQGGRWSEQVAHALYPVAASVRVLRFPSLPDKGDVYDWLEKGHTGEELVALATRTARFEPAQQSDADTEEPLDAGEQ